jgi:hypothetical protein
MTDAQPLCNLLNNSLVKFAFFGQLFFREPMIGDFG